MSVIEEAIQGVERELLRLMSEEGRPRVLVEAMRWANVVGLVNGVGAARLAPAGTTTRAQAAVILARFCRQYIDAALGTASSESATGGTSGGAAAGSTPAADSTAAVESAAAAESTAAVESEVLQ